MKEKIFKFNLDVKDKEFKTGFNLVQLDNTSRFIIKLFDDGEPYEMTKEDKVEVAIVKNDGTFVVIEAEFYDNSVTCLLTENALAIPGMTKCEVRVLNGSKVLTSASFKIYIRENIVNNEKIKSTSEYKALEGLINEAKIMQESLKKGESVIEDVNKIKENLTEIKESILNKSKEIDDNLAVADEKINLIKTHISKSETAIENLTNNQNKIENLSNLLTELEKIRLTLDEINNSVNKANTQKVELDKSTENAENVKNNLDESIANATSTNITLKATDTQAKKTEALIKDLMNQLNLTKDEVSKIIAAGDLSQYVTDPKLQEALKLYATKEDLSKIDVTSQLVDYAKKTDLDSKVNKVNGKALSSNDYTNADKAKVDAIPLNPKYTDTTYDLSGYAKKTDIKTKLSEMTSDNTHRTVTDTEKQSWNKKFELPDGKENQVLTKTTDGAEFKEISSSRSATFVIANYDSSENSKSGADYVIQESDCAAEIINGFITKLPSYGGKIQLTEGNFNIKKNESIDLTKNNTIIEGYGNATTIIDKSTKDERKLVIVNISPGVTNCRLSDLNITHEASNSIKISGNKNYIKNVNVINNGTYPSVYFNDNTSENVLENCNAESPSHCYKINNTSENNKILNCSGTSTNNATFYIDGPNNLILNCSGISDKSNAFTINNSGIRLIGCKAKTNPNTSVSDIWFTSNSKSCISLANQYYKKCSNEGSNNIVVNNTKLEV